LKTRDELNAKIAELKVKVETVKGSECDVYTRIVGYYRSVKNWNAGRRAEFDKRLPFKIPEVVK